MVGREDVGGASEEWDVRVREVGALGSQLLLLMNPCPGVEGLRVVRSLCPAE